MIKGIIFDLDGVLCGTDRYHFLAWKEIMATLHVELSPAAMDLVRGVERMKSLELLLADAGISLPEEEKVRLAQEKNERYKTLLAQMTPAELTPGAAEALIALRREGYLLAVGSASKNAKTVLARLGLEGFFDGVSDGNGLSRPKPDPEVFLRAARLLSLPPEECAVVEDAPSGVEAAERGGFVAIGMKRAMDDPHTDYPLPAFGEIVNIIHKINGANDEKHS